MKKRASMWKGELHGGFQVFSVRHGQAQSHSQEVGGSGFSGFRV